MSTTIVEVVSRLKDGVLRAGAHEENGEACALEAVSRARGVPWTDRPEAVGMPDLRPINDGPWESDKTRTEALLPVLVALWEWRSWPEARKRRWAKAVALATVREILPLVLRTCGLHDHAARCAKVQTLGTAAEVAEAAARAAEAAAEAAEAAEVAARAAEAAEVAARAAARAAEAAATPVLSLACSIWIKAAKDTE